MGKGQASRGQREDDCGAVEVGCDASVVMGLQGEQCKVEGDSRKEKGRKGMQDGRRKWGRKETDRKEERREGKIGTERLKERRDRPILGLLRTMDFKRRTKWNRGQGCERPIALD